MNWLRHEFSLCSMNRIANARSAIHVPEVQFMKSLISIHAVRQFIEKIWQYIDTNALKWEQDKFYVKEKE